MEIRGGLTFPLQNSIDLHFCKHAPDLTERGKVRDARMGKTLDKKSMTFNSVGLFSWTVRFDCATVSYPSNRQSETAFPTKEMCQDCAKPDLELLRMAKGFETNWFF